MTSMIEKVARAIWKQERDSKAHDEPFRLSWYEAPARAALEAMLEPTEEMNIAGQVVGDYPWDGKKPSRVFTAMIQSALSHNPGTEDGR